MDLLADKALDVVVGLVSTLVAIGVTYLLARPRVEIRDHVRRGIRADGSTRYGLGVRNRGPLHLTHMHVVAIISIRGQGRWTSVPLPLSRAEWWGVAPRPRVGPRTWSHPRGEPRGWDAVPRLLLHEVDWSRHLPPGITAPGVETSLPDLLRELDAKLTVTVVTTTTVFGVARITRRSFSGDEPNFVWRRRRASANEA